MQDGLGAVKNVHRGLIEDELRSDFEDSLDIDMELREGRESENRWDYLLGHAPNSVVVALEPHPASTREVSVVIAKRSKAKEQLRPHLAEGARIAAWIWIASGRIDFVPHDKQMHRLMEAGITFVGGRLLRKHLARLP